MDKINREMLYHLEGQTPEGVTEEAWKAACEAALEKVPFSGIGSWGEHIRKIRGIAEKNRGKN